MHFFYIDESGDTGLDLQNVEQPILVLGCIDVKDAGWMKTQSAMASVIGSYFNADVPENFELHAAELLSPNGDGPFAGHSMDHRTHLASDLLDLLADRGHSVHYIAVHKASLLTSDCEAATVYDTAHPWLLAYDYLITHLNWYVKEKLGHTARGMIIHDEKTNLHNDIERIAHERRFEGPKSQRVKWIVEFSYPVDSRKNPMIQLSDLVSYCTRKFLEIEHGYCDDWGLEAKQFYAQCYRTIDGRLRRKALVERGGAAYRPLNEHLERVRSTPTTRWRANWFG